MHKPILFLASILALCSCSSNGVESLTLPEYSESAVETDKTKRYEFDLNKENYWRFLDLSLAVTNGGYGNASWEADIIGVLSYAYYENVVVTFDFEATGTGSIYGGEEKTYKGKIKAELNAAGCFRRTYDYNYIPESLSPDFTGDSFYSYTRIMSFHSITGKVLFSI